MNLTGKICQICGKHRGNNGVNHAICSKKLQQMNVDKKRTVAPVNLGAKHCDRLASLILRKTA